MQVFVGDNGGNDDGDNGDDYDNDEDDDVVGELRPVSVQLEAEL